MCALHPNSIITCICDVCVRMLNSSSKHESGMLQTFSLFRLIPAGVKHNTFFPVACVFPAATIWLIRVAVVCQCVYLSIRSACVVTPTAVPYTPLGQLVFVFTELTNIYRVFFFLCGLQREWFKTANIEHFMTGMNGLLCHLVIHTELFGLFCMWKCGMLWAVLSFPYEAPQGELRRQYMLFQSFVVY